LASRYWVGGTGDWDGTAGTKWATTSGGAGGSAVPTSADDVFFDANSGANTVTIGAGTAICDSLTMTGFTGTLAFGTNSIDLTGSGSNTFLGATTYSVTGTPLINITGTGTLTVTAGAVTEANSISFTINNAASNAIGITGSIRNLTFAGTYTGNLTNSTRTLYGNLTIKSGMTLSAGTNTTTFAATSGTQTITSAGLNLDFPITINGVGTTVQLADNLSVGTATGRRITLTNGTLDLNDKTLTNFGDFVSNNTNTRSILFGTTGNITLTSTASATIFNISTATNFSITGTPTINVTGNAVAGGTRRLDYGTTALPSSPEANAISVYVTNGSDSVQLPQGFVLKNLDFTGSFTGSLINSTRTIYGNLTLNPNMTAQAGTSTNSFVATSGTQLITSAGVNLDFPITFAGTATYQLVDNLSVGTTTSRRITLTSGTLDLNDKTLTNFGEFVSSNTNTRSIAFGTTGTILLTANNTTIWSFATATNFTFTGTSSVNATYSGSVGTRTLTFGATAGLTESNALNYFISAGSDIVASSNCKNLDYTGFTGTITNAGRTVYGNLTFSSGMTTTAGGSATTFAATSGTQLLTSAGITIDFPISINGVGTTVQLVDALIMGSTRGLGLTNGTFNSNAKNVTCGTFSAANSNTKTLNISNSTVTIQGGSTAPTGFIVNSAGTTYNLTGCNIVFTTAGVTSFYAAGGTPATVTMGGTGQLIIGAASVGQTITTLANTVQPCTVSLLSTTPTCTVTNFNLSGTAGNLVTFNSSVAGTARTISKTSGTVNAYYLNIQDSTASGGAVWNAYDSTDAGNNTGWNFLTANSGNFLLMFG
jgi:hypothetical protein